MRGILVPLDGTALSASILPDAKRLAGPGGTLILVRDASSPIDRSERGWDRAFIAIARAEEYLDRLAFVLRHEGYGVQTDLYVLGTPTAAISAAMKQSPPDMVACATHGRNAIGQLVHGSVAWRTFAESPVPVLLRHAISPTAMRKDEERRSIMVPLDGSAYAERALTLAGELATEWNASVRLVHVIPEIRAGLLGSDRVSGGPHQTREDIAEAQAHLAAIQRSLPGEVYIDVLYGDIVPSLVRLVRRRAITDIVMASHGRTGWSRVMLGSVADGLLHQLTRPIIVVPALAAPGQSRETGVTERVPVEA
jgi:nucleotide-binding universal stress UspA family protein